MKLGQFSKLPAIHRTIFVLLFAYSIPIVLIFLPYTFSLANSWGMRVSAIGLCALALLTLLAVLRQEVWAAWSALVVVSGKLTVDLYAYATHFDTIGPLVSAAVAAVIIFLAFRIGEPSSKTVTRRQRVFFAIIVAFPAWVAAGGIFFVHQIDDFLPFVVPPLHARFISAMYLAGATMMLFASTARAWHEIRVVTAILAIWTGLLGVVSMLHLDAFNWAARPTWFWWFAYIWFPLGAAFIWWNQRRETGHPAEPSLSLLLRGFLAAQGTVAVMIALVSLLAPGTMIKLWPWAITPLLAQIYSAPFLAYGVGSLYASRQLGWSEIRISVLATLMLTFGAIIASLLHIGLFNEAHPSTWVWFGGLGFVSVALAIAAAVPRLRNASHA